MVHDTVVSTLRQAQYGAGSTTFYIVPFLVISNEAKRREKSLVCGRSEISLRELDEHH
ncbi:MAG: hypothetical protein SFU91_06255 [Chloroherpetonaceae bacterium]|nr:hypothetical protein [Chloroherpetonaceae bacterium]